MSYIPCSANCCYQYDGLCSLNHAAGISATGAASHVCNGCLHYVPRNGTLKGARFHEAPQQYSIPEPGSDP